VKETLSVLAGLLFVVGFVPYIRAILQKETKPAKATWLIWASLDTITFVGMFFKDTVLPKTMWAAHCEPPWTLK